MKMMKKRWISLLLILVLVMAAGNTAGNGKGYYERYVIEEQDRTAVYGIYIPAR